ncbi:hypothetical protein GCK72_007108 [Caenorhabditis remanei]|uniref:F-box domain-containing protein n=1 Tax=Caenorhabditis remanei TaxID=31234 RepID=A0A6A5HIA9_CAERE|nr:hypothetical protein GCK72_007108 [Caenorhabditis remanei]KAF1767149.1 hypothetical protein GCK72_007108 [Caenorhabditis remanei]
MLVGPFGSVTQSTTLLSKPVMPIASTEFPGDDQASASINPADSNDTAKIADLVYTGPLMSRLHMMKLALGLCGAEAQPDISRVLCESRRRSAKPSEFLAKSDASKSQTGRLLHKPNSCVKPPKKLQKSDQRPSLDLQTGTPTDSTLTVNFLNKIPLPSSRMISVLHLFHLPQVVLFEVFRFLKPNDLIPIALCSQRAFNLVRVNWKKSTKALIWMDSRLYFSSHLKINYIFYNLLTVSRIEDVPGNQLELVQIKGSKVPIRYNREKNSLETYWDDVCYGFKAVMEFVTELFSSDIHTVVFEKNTFWCVEWAQSRQKRLMNAHIYQDQYIENSEYRTIMNSCTSENLMIHAYQLGEKCLNETSFRIRNHLSIDCGRWVQVEHLMNMDCVEIEVQQSSLKKSDVTYFLKNWLNGGNSRLKYLSIATQYFGIDLFCQEEFPENMVRSDREMEYERPSQIYDDQATPITAEIPEKKKKAGEKAVEKIEVEVD